MPAGGYAIERSEKVRQFVFSFAASQDRLKGASIASATDQDIITSS